MKHDRDSHFSDLVIREKEIKTSHDREYRYQTLHFTNQLCVSDKTGSLRKMSGGSLRMSDAETLKFLECYRNEPVLWDPTNEGYKIKETRAAAAQRVARALNIPDFTAAHVIVKFKNLRSSYAQELKKIAASTKSGVSNDNIYVPKVIWFKLMDAFLRPHVKSRAMLYNLVSNKCVS